MRKVGKYNIRNLLDDEAICNDKDSDDDEESEESSDESEAAAISEKLKRPRGRPPKVLVTDNMSSDGSDYSAVLEKIKRPRGRPPKQPDNLNNITNKMSKYWEEYESNNNNIEPVQEVVEENIGTILNDKNSNGLYQPGHPSYEISIHCWSITITKVKDDIPYGSLG